MQSLQALYSLLILSVPIAVAGGSLRSAVEQDSATGCRDLQIRIQGACDVAIGPCCFNSTFLAICASAQGNGMNPAFWSLFECPDTNETCESVFGDKEYGCVAVSSIPELNYSWLANMEKGV